MKKFFFLLISCETMSVGDIKKNLKNYSLNFIGTLNLASKGSSIEGVIESKDDFKEWSLDGQIFNEKFFLKMTQIDQSHDLRLKYHLRENELRYIKVLLPYIKVFYLEWTYFHQEGSFCPQERENHGTYYCLGSWVQKGNKIFFHKDDFQIELSQDHLVFKKGFQKLTISKSF